MTTSSLSPPPLEVLQCSAGYGRREIFSDLSLVLQPGEIFGLIGLNGVGKTTLIKSLLDLGPLRSGLIRIFGRDHRQAASRQHLAYLPDRFQPASSLRGDEFLALARAHFRLPPDAARNQACCLALGLDPAVLPQPIRTYSKGMGQKLALAATFVTGRPLVILDEPMSGLDPLARVQLKRQLLASRAEGHTVFFSSHILADIEEICDRVGVFHGGQMRFIGAPGELLRSTGAASLEAAFLQAIGEEVAA
ncbi:ABC transporter ATP-binding protein [Polaromonas sp.]|uniref:ABC transporter ATP-binding protein n=1 Tax=Polaromonas sp. TaxID=1869339 RepID=UPI003564229B